MSEECERNDYFLVVFDGKTNDKMNGCDHGIHRSVMSRSIPTENISTAQRRGGGTHQKKNGEEKKEKTIQQQQQQRQMASTYTFVIFFARVCLVLAGAVLIFITAGWRGSFRQ